MNTLLASPGYAGVPVFPGVPVFESIVVPETQEEPARKHVCKPWMSGRAYHERIQKKWNRRFGFEVTRPVWRTADGIFIHPNNKPLLHKMLEEPNA